MLPGKADDVDQWVVDYEDTKALADDVQSALQERNLKYPNGGSEASRITAQVRRNLGSLGSKTDALQKKLEADTQISEAERNRRRNLVTSLRTRKEQLQQQIKRGDGPGGSRGALFSGSTGSANAGGPAAETEATADRDNAGILKLQTDVMRHQDTELEALGKTVTSTRHIALAVNEELTLHTRLLVDLDEELDVTHGRMRVAQKRLRHVMRKSGGCKCSCFIVALVVGLVLLLLVVFKLVV